MDLSPREVVPTAVGRKRKRPVMAILVLVVVLAAGGVVVAKFLTSAIDYYCNVDEIGHKSGCDVGRTLRVQGIVEKGSVASSPNRTDFVIRFNGVSMPVQLDGEPGGVFKECVPVVVSGRVDNSSGSDVFLGDTVLVKHDNKYDSANKDRVAKAKAEADRCSAQA
jgi:cytochrome c-type biogenesis protein CcmE